MHFKVHKGACAQQGCGKLIVLIGNDDSPVFALPFILSITAAKDRWMAQVGRYDSDLRGIWRVKVQYH